MSGPLTAIERLRLDYPSWTVSVNPRTCQITAVWCQGKGKVTAKAFTVAGCRAAIQNLSHICNVGL